MPTDLQSIQDSSGPMMPNRAGAPSAELEWRQETHAFKSFVATVLRYRRILVATFLAPVAAAIGLSLIPPKTYEAEARLLVLIGSEYVFRPEVGQAGAGMALNVPSITKTETEILLSRSLHEEVVRTIGPTMLYPELQEPPTESWSAVLLRQVQALAQEAVAATSLWSEFGQQPDAPPPVSLEQLALDRALINFDGHLTVEPLRESSVIRIAFSHTDPEVAANTVNQLVDAYFKRRGLVLSRTQAMALEGPYHDMTSRLDTIEAELDRFKAEYQVIDFTREVSIALDQRARLEDVTRAAEADLAKARAHLDDLRNTLDRTPPEVTLYTSNELALAFQHGMSMLNELESEREGLRTRFMDNHPKMIAIDNHIAQLRRQLARTQRTEQTRRVGINPVHEQVERLTMEAQAEVAALESMVETAKAQLEAFAQRANSLREAETRYRVLERERAVLVENQLVYGQRLEEARILDQLGQDRSNNVRLIQAALPPVHGQSLLGVIQALGVITGVIASLFMAFLLEAMRSVFVIPQNALGVLGLPVLATVPALGRRELRQLYHAQGHLGPGAAHRTPPEARHDQLIVKDSRE